MSVGVARELDISDELRERLAAIAQGLIPAAEGMPAASEIDISGRQLDLVLRSRPDLIHDLLRAVSQVEEVGDPISWMDRLRKDDPPAHEALAVAIVAGYYMHPEVKSRLGYPGQVSQEVNAGAFPEYVSEGLLERVVERGPIYRPTPKSR
jgi:hypothetical protein